MPDINFITLAIAMVAAAIVLVVIPLLRRGDPSPIAAGTVVALLPFGVAILYFTYSNWEWDKVAVSPPGQQPHNEQTTSLAEAAVQLEEKLRNSPDDAEGWQMLGRTYVVLSRYSGAVQAYSKARELTADKDVNAVTGFAEALAMMRGGAMDDEITGLFEKTLAMAPDDPKSLWYGGLAAFEKGNPQLAKDRWQHLLTQDPPEQMAVVLREQIAAANAALGERAQDAPIESLTAAAGTPAASPSEATIRDSTTVGATEIEGLALSVSIVPELASRVNPNAPLFILARQAGVPGPPIAVVRRLAGELPVEIVLTDANSMMAGRILSGFESVEIIARISMSGAPTAQSGDLSGSKQVASQGRAAIVINSVVGD